MDNEQELEFQKWWNEVGSGIYPLRHEDQEEHAMRVAYSAYCAGVKDMQNTE